MAPMPQEFATVPLAEPLRLSAGGRLEHVTVAYGAWGERRPGSAVVLLHGLSRSHRALCAQATPGRSSDGWANALFASGQPLDPAARHWIVCPNLLGSPFGSTSPASAEWAGRPFPELSVLDQADAVHGFMQALGLKKPRVVGFSLGGMVALALAARHPACLRGAATLGGPVILPAAGRRRLGLVATMLLADPEYRADGQGEGAVRALKRARLAMLRDLYPHDHALRGGAFESERALEAEADSFARTFDGRCYLSLCRAMSACDLSGAVTSIKARFLVAASSSDPLATAASMQDTYHLLTAAGVRTRYFEVGGEGGHHAFYREANDLAFALRDMVNG
jgi:homoserine O-acetyltransferase/O-succinyltransferase